MSSSNKLKISYKTIITSLAYIKSVKQIVTIKNSIIYYSIIRLGPTKQGKLEYKNMINNSDSGEIMQIINLPVNSLNYICGTNSGNVILINFDKTHSTSKLIREYIGCKRGTIWGIEYNPELSPDKFFVSNSPLGVLLYDYSNDEPQLVISIEKTVSSILIAKINTQFHLIIGSSSFIYVKKIVDINNNIIEEICNCTMNSGLIWSLLVPKNNSKFNNRIFTGSSQIFVCDLVNDQLTNIVQVPTSLNCNYIQNIFEMPNNNKCFFIDHQEGIEIFEFEDLTKAVRKIDVKNLYGYAILSDYHICFGSKTHLYIYDVNSFTIVFEYGHNYKNMNYRILYNEVYDRLISIGMCENKEMHLYNYY